jgi:putative acetyltransferase
MGRNLGDRLVTGRDVVIRREDPGAPGVERLLKAGEAAMAALYPAESNHVLSLDGLRAPGVAVWVARQKAALREESGEKLGRAVATAALVVESGEHPALTWGEIKRMWVEPDRRGAGCGAAMLEAIEAWALALGLKGLRLEAGARSASALSLYARAGFARRGRFGFYGADPLSVFMEKPLRPAVPRKSVADAV